MTFFKVVLACLLAIGIFNFADTVMHLVLRSEVYACSSDKEKLPTEIHKQCQILTKGQWWSK